MDLAGRKAAIVMATSNIQRLTLAGAAADNGAAGHIAKGVGHPAVAVAGEQLKIVFNVLLSAVWHIGAALVGYHLGRQQIAIVIGTSDKDGIAIGIMAGQYGAGHNVAAGRADPCLRLDEHLVCFQLMLGTAVRYVQAAVRWMHLAGRQTALEIAATHKQRLPLGGLAHAQSMRRHLAMAGRYPAVMVSGEDLVIVLANLLAAPGHVRLMLVGYHLGGEHVAVVIGAAHIDRILIRIVAGGDGKWR